MKYKSDEIAEMWRRPKLPPDGNPEKIAKTQNYAILVDHLFRLLGYGEVTITDYHRPVNPKRKSFHPKLQAFDVRIHHLSTEQRRLAIKIFIEIRRADNELQCDPHYSLWGEGNEHFHFEVDDKKPV